MALSREFPGFYRYALIMEEASEAERNKASRPYDGMAEFSEQHKQMGEQLLTTAVALERGYQAFRAESFIKRSFCRTIAAPREKVHKHPCTQTPCWRAL